MVIIDNGEYENSPPLDPKFKKLIIPCNGREPYLLYGVARGSYSPIQAGDLYFCFRNNSWIGVKSNSRTQVLPDRYINPEYKALLALLK